jgi:hypothetical protein
VIDLDTVDTVVNETLTAFLDSAAKFQSKSISRTVGGPGKGSPAIELPGETVSLSLRASGIT